MSEPQHYPPGSETILYIEDHWTIRQSVSAILGRVGYHVLEADTAQEGLALFRKHAGEIDLVLLDLRLPDQWGGKLLPVLRAIDPQVKVVVFTGRPWTAEDVEGAHAVVEKPASLALVLQTVRAALDAA